MINRSLPVVVAMLAIFGGAQLSLAQAPAAPAAAAAANPAQGPIVTTLRTQWRGVRDKVINICDIVPEDKLDFKATPDVRSFRELIIHIAGEGYNFLRPLGSVPGVTRGRLGAACIELGWAAGVALAAGVYLGPRGG